MKFFASYTSLPEKSLRRRFNGCLLGGCVTPFLWLILTLFIDVAVFPFDPPWKWESTSGKPVPVDFRYAMFPATPAISAYDRADGVPVATLDRAMLNTQLELNDAWISLAQSDPAQALWVRRADLVFDTASPVREMLIQAASNAYAAAHTSQFARIIFHAKLAAGGIEVNLQLRPDDNNVEEYVYTVAAGVPTPIKMRRYFGPGVALQSMGTLPIAGLIAAATLKVLYVALKRLRKKRMARNEASGLSPSQ